VLAKIKDSRWVVTESGSGVITVSDIDTALLIASFGHYSLVTLNQHDHNGQHLQVLAEQADYVHQLETMRLADLMQELSLLRWDLKLFENEILFNGNTSSRAILRKQRTAEKLSAVEREIRIRTGLDDQ
jgi:hypothetical protein